MVYWVNPIKVRELAKTNVISCKPTDPIKCAVVRMYENNVGSVAIVDDDNRPIGIFTERDLVRVVARGISLETPLAEVMSKNLITINPEDSTVSAAVKMLENNIRHLPVIENDRIIGMISIRDVLRALMAQELSYP